MASLIASAYALALALAAGAAGALPGVLPSGLVAALAGLALLAALMDALTKTVETDLPIGAFFALAIAASPLTLLGVGSAFWALVGGLAVSLLLECQALARAWEAPKGKIPHELTISPAHADPRAANHAAPTTSSHPARRAVGRSVSSSGQRDLNRHSVHLPAPHHDPSGGMSHAAHGITRTGDDAPD